MEKGLVFLFLYLHIVEFRTIEVKKFAVYYCLSVLKFCSVPFYFFDRSRLKYVNSFKYA